MQRDRLIRQYVNEHKEIQTAKAAVRRSERELHSRIRRDLDIDAGDFGIACKLNQLALRKQERTLGSVREVLLALGNAIPQLESGTGEPPALGPVKAEVMAAIVECGPATTSRLRESSKSLAALKSLNTHLSQLERAGKIIRNGAGEWTLPDIGTPN
jgi:hypothetical protein